MEEWAKVISELGLGAALALMMFIAFFFLLKWVLKASSEQLQIMAEERKAWREMQGEFSDRIRDLQEGSRAFHTEVRDAHKFQRDEHREMISCLGRINGYKER
jgi:C4-dicarboxylate-specific signal transduction histidine kinase